MIRRLITQELLSLAVLHREMLTHMHTEHGHQGVERTFKLVQSRCYWPGMFKDVEAFCKACECCIVKHPSQGLLQHWGVCWPLGCLKWLQENVLVLTDMFSKFTITVPFSAIRGPC